MKIAEFQTFIREFPCKNQSFDIKQKYWQVPSQQKLIDEIFGNDKVITLNRYDLINSNYDLKGFIIKTLMWGYPTKGRGRNIENMLESENFERLITVLEKYRDSDVTVNQLKADIKDIAGMGLSTLTKFAHFLNTTIEGNKAVIFDNQIIMAINNGRFDEFKCLKAITHENAPKRYLEYLQVINNLSKLTYAAPEQIEMFLFTFGRNVSELKGEECYDFD